MPLLDGFHFPSLVQLRDGPVNKEETSRKSLFTSPPISAARSLRHFHRGGADFEVRPLNFRKRKNSSPRIPQINRKPNLPALVVDGTILAENFAIPQWVHRTSPRPRTRPPIRGTSCRTFSLARLVCQPIHPYLSPINNPPKACDATGLSYSDVK